MVAHPADDPPNGRKLFAQGNSQFACCLRPPFRLKRQAAFDQPSQSEVTLVLRSRTGIGPFFWRSHSWKASSSTDRFQEIAERQSTRQKFIENHPQGEQV